MLLDAPRVVRDVAPMSWQYLQAPPDGSIFLTFQPPQRQSAFASDGYVWVDPETVYTQELNGFVSGVSVEGGAFFSLSA